MNLPQHKSQFGDEAYRRKLDQCIHCGLCLQACPTYVAFGRETDSPRGRISLIRAATEGRIDLSGGALQAHLDLCLTCRSCETACPSGVQYGALLDVARLAIEQARQPGPQERLIRWLALRQLMPQLPRLKLIAWFARLYQLLGLSRLVRALNFLPEHLKALEGSLPPLPAHYDNYQQPAPALGPKCGAVAFFHGCIQEAFLAKVNAATIRVLQENGYEVHFPQGQTCCGAAQLHLGEEELARELARRNIDAVFNTQPAGVEYLAIINNAGGCGSLLKDYAHLLQDEPAYAARSRQFTELVKDISEFLVEHEFNAPLGHVSARATYSDSCHLRHAQKVIRQPREIIRAIPGIELVELAHPEHCCGSAGVYNITQTESANAILDLKLQDIQATGANLIVVSNTGCHLQLINGVRRSNSKARVVHFVELLDESYQLGKELKHEGHEGH